MFVVVFSGDFAVCVDSGIVYTMSRLNIPPASRRKDMDNDCRPKAPRTPSQRLPLLPRPAWHCEGTTVYML
jgi:hypothetical protein